MKGLIIKDFLCFKKQLISYAFILAGVIVISLLFALSFRYGNIARLNQEWIAEEQMTAEDTTEILRIAMLIFMLTPIACVGDVSALFTADADADFIKLSAALPVSAAKRLAARYKMAMLLIGSSVMIDIAMSFWLSSITAVISFARFTGVVVSFASVMMMYVSNVILLIAILGVGKTGFAVYAPVIAGVVAFIVMNRDILREMLLSPGAEQLVELYDNVRRVIETRYPLLLLAGCIVMLLSYVLTVVIARKKRGIC